MYTTIRFMPMRAYGNMSLLQQFHWLIIISTIMIPS